MGTDAGSNIYLLCVGNIAIILRDNNLFHFAKIFWESLNTQSEYFFEKSDTHLSFWFLVRLAVNIKCQPTIRPTPRTYWEKWMTQ